MGAAWGAVTPAAARWSKDPERVGWAPSGFNPTLDLDSLPFPCSKTRRIGPNAVVARGSEDETAEEEIGGRESMAVVFDARLLVVVGIPLAVAGKELPEPATLPIPAPNDPGDLRAR